MIKNIIAVAVVVALSACSSGSNDSTPANGGAQNPGTGAQNPGTGTINPGTGTINPGVDPNFTPSTVPAPGGGFGPAAGTAANTYVGYVGADPQQLGVYVVRNDFSFQGLAIQGDGSAQSRFGNIGASTAFEGGVRQYAHAASQPTKDDGGFGSVASRASNDLNINVNINANQTIEGETPTAVFLTANAAGTVSASANTLAGVWNGSNQFNCNPGPCLKLNTTLTFTGNSVSGSTNVVGETGFPSISGTIADFNGAVLFDFDWGDNEGYSGLVFFVPDNSGRIAFVGERIPLPGEPANTAGTISGILEKQLN